MSFVGNTYKKQIASIAFCTVAGLVAVREIVNNAPIIKDAITNPLITVPIGIALAPTALLFFIKGMALMYGHSIPLHEIKEDLNNTGREIVDFVASKLPPFTKK